MKNYIKRKKNRHHDDHERVEKEIKQFENDKSYEDEWFNQPPTEKEIIEIIEAKKNGKATTDLNNEIIKNTKEEFIKIFMPMLKLIWEKEEIPQEWNKGRITTLWKGKGDKECLDNHRGITVSSTVGGIMEEAIDRRMDKLVVFTQGQAGGKKGASTVDQLFLLRSLMTLAIEKKQNIFVTFYDVAKAYDHADVHTMLNIIWKAGVRGKIWRILKNMSTNLTAVVKTRYGISRTITRENGGRQGSRLIGKLFGKQMDVLCEHFINNHIGVHITNQLRIGCLEFVDDALSCAEGKENQLKTLEKVDDFARSNKLEWGAKKCQVMQIGTKVKVPEEWDLGEKKIINTTSYKYLGDMITSDNKNKQNIITKENKLQQAIRQINTTASSDIMYGIETTVILELYETCALASFLNNCESWTLTPTEEKNMDRIGLQAVKRLFNILNTTPSTAIIYNLGLLYTTQSIDHRRFMYFHKLLTRNEENWTRKMLHHLHDRNTGWAKSLIEKLTEYRLEPDWEKIKALTKNQWKEVVKNAINERNKQKLITNCTTTTPQETKVNTKSKYIYN